MKSLSEIQEKLSVVKPYLFGKYPLKSLAIFGSYARGESNQASDLDLLVEVDAVIGSRFVDLADEIEEMVGMRIDLVSRDGVKPKYLEAIKPDLVYV
ncbi:MAG: nucleotidyltransferase domain-containing protein [Tunicatimonas sp.]